MWPLLADPLRVLAKPRFMLHEVVERLTALARRTGHAGMGSRRRGLAEIEADLGEGGQGNTGARELLVELLVEVRALGAVIRATLSTGAPVGVWMGWAPGDRRELWRGRRGWGQGCCGVLSRRNTQAGPVSIWVGYGGVYCCRWLSCDAHRNRYRYGQVSVGRIYSVVERNKNTVFSGIKNEKKRGRGIDKKRSFDVRRASAGSTGRARGSSIGSGESLTDAVVGEAS